MEDLFWQMFGRYSLAVDILDEIRKQDFKNAARYTKAFRDLEMSDFEGVQNIIERYAHILLDIRRNRLAEVVVSDDFNAKVVELFNRGHMRYEVACEIIGALITHFAEQIGRERSAQVSDFDLIRFWGEAQQSLRLERDALSPNDLLSIGRVIQIYAPAVKLLYRKPTVTLI